MDTTPRITVGARVRVGTPAIRHSNRTGEVVGRGSMGEASVLLDGDRSPTPFYPEELLKIGWAKGGRG